MSRSRLSHQRHRAAPAPARASSGFTLIELMVALVLGLIVIAGVVSVFLANQQVYRTNQAIGDVQDGSRIAFELMAQDIRSAGLTGCSNNGLVANVLNNGPNGSLPIDWWADLANAVHGYDITQVDPAIAFGTTSLPPSRLSGTPSLQLLGAGNLGVTVLQTINAANFTISSTSTAIQPGDVEIVCDPTYAAIFQVTGYQNNNTVAHNNGTGTPGNCSKGLGYPPVCTPNGTFYPYGPNSQLAKLTAADWFIGTNPVKGLSLYRSDLENIGGTPTIVPHEIVRDVTAMTLLYHQAPQATFVKASAVTNWAVVDAVQVTLSTASTDKRAGTNVQAITRTFSATTTVRNRVN